MTDLLYTHCTRAISADTRLTKHGASRALVYLDSANDDARAFYQRHHASGVTRAIHPLTEAMWERLRDPKQDRYVGALLAAVSGARAAIAAEPHDAYGLRRKNRRPIETDPLLVSKAFSIACKALAVAPAPEVYVQSEHPGGLLLALCRHKHRVAPAFVARADMLGQKSEAEVMFEVATRVSSVRPEHLPSYVVLTPTERGIRVWAAIALVRPDQPAPASLRGQVRAYAAELGNHIAASEREQLSNVVDRYMDTRPRLDVSAWHVAVQSTCRRAGLLLADDLDVALGAVADAPVSDGDAAPSDAIRELLGFSVSEGYFALRKHTGICVR